jgi:hypothetical protein
MSQRWCYYQLFVTGKPRTQFIGRRLGDEMSKGGPPERVFSSLYQDQDGNLYLTLLPGELPMLPDSVSINCSLYLEGRTREELREEYRKFAKRQWDTDDPLFPRYLDAPLLPIEDTGYDS